MIKHCRICGKQTVDVTNEALIDIIQPYHVTTVCPRCENEEREEVFFRLCPPLYRESDPSKLSKSHLDKVLAWQINPKGLLLTGPTNVGKTRMVWMLLKKIIPSDMVVFDGVSFGHELNRHYRQEDAEDWLDRVASASLVFFDDLGKLKLTDRAEAELFGILERRCAHLKPIIATTNEVGETLASMMTEGRAAPFIRRLRAFCDVISFWPEDDRQA